MARPPALFGFGKYPNVVAFPSTTVTVEAAYEPATMKAINLKTEEPSELSRILTLLPQYSYWLASFGNVPREIGGLALVNVNLSPNGLVRFLGNAQAPPFAFDAPTGIGASDNITGGFANVDESLATPDSNFIEPTDPTASWSVRLTFPTPAQLPKQGEHMALFALRMLLVVPAGLSFYPTVTVSLYESGSLVRVLASKPVTTSTGDGQLLFFTFDPAELVTASLSGAELLIECTPGDGAGLPPYAKLNTATLVTDTSTLLVNDSGWIPSPEAGRVEDEDDPGFDIKVDHFPETPWQNIDYFITMVLDDQAVVRLSAEETPVAAVVRQPGGYVQAGVMPAGPTLVLERAPRMGPQSSVIIDGFEGFTEGGQTYGSDTFRRRAMTVDLTLNRTEKDEITQGVSWRRGRSGAIYVNLDPELAPEHSELFSGWVTVAEAGPAIPIQAAYDPGDLQLFSMTLSFEQRL